MSIPSKKASIPLTKSKDEKLFLCRLVEGRNQNGVLKIPSAFAAFFASMNLNIVGLHLPCNKTWLGRYISHSETIEGIESLMEYFDVNPCYSFSLEYIGGTEFKVEIFSEYAVEIEYSRRIMRGVAREPVFHQSELDKEKIKSAYSYSSACEFEREFDFVITDKHLERKRWMKVLPKDEALDVGLDPEMKWFHLGFQKITWKIHLKWTEDEILFDSEWNELTKACKLAVGDRCVFICTFSCQRFKLAVFHKDQAMNTYKHGAEEGKGFLKWFKVLHWMNLLTGEVEIPTVFAEKYGSGFKDTGTIYTPDGMVYSCYLSKTSKLLYGIKDLMAKYTIRADSTVFFEYIGNSVFYATIFDEHGLEIFNDLPLKLILSSVVDYMTADLYVISDSDSEIGIAAVGVEHTTGNNLTSGQSSGIADVGREQTTYAISTSGMHSDVVGGHTMGNNSTYGQTSVIAEEADANGQTSADPISFTINLLRSHVDQNYHGVFLPRFLFEMYKKWKKGTIVTLIMGSKSYKMGILRRKKTCRLGVGWNEFTLKNKLYEGQNLVFTYAGNETFHVTENV